eukprot:CAMPEP_0180139788 /NCGR_PEP_ID=MMETSP0986-20121125/13776_1 /TAXON_ID=697907 /ORGANISM="non described non described, Strain CCMP2293" /LENGTH=55 /DNA_ID=CAMNT_0022082027 /DNA_START=18 /DNA_END=185 /DNA_ORIENTATION=+
MFALIQQLHQIRATTMLDGNGDPQCDSVLDMPDSTATGNIFNPPDYETSNGMEYN